MPRCSRVQKKENDEAYWEANGRRCRESRKKYAKATQAERHVRAERLYGWERQRVDSALAEEEPIEYDPKSQEEIKVCQESITGPTTTTDNDNRDHDR